MKKRVQYTAEILSIAVAPVLAVWIPFFFRMKSVWGIPLPVDGMRTIAANYDGPLYIVVAKSFYNLELIANNFSFSLPLEYYAAHFPLYPLTIKLFSLITQSFPWSMLVSTIAGSIFCIYYFRKFISQHVSKKDVLWITFVFSLFPARWLIVRSVGSPEPMFVGLIIASVYHFEKKQYWLAGLFGALAQLTKSPAILLFVSYGFAVLIPKLRELSTNHDALKWMKTLNFKAFPVVLIPLALLGLFLFYGARFGDVLAYFHSGDNIHLFFPPFQIFNYSQPWVNTHWLEEVIFIYLFGMLGIVELAKQKRTTYLVFVVIFFTTLLFVSHRDLIRYALPIIPFLYVAFAKQITSKEFKFIMLILIIPIYLFSLAFISNNIMPISDWTPLL